MSGSLVSLCLNKSFSTFTIPMFKKVINLFTPKTAAPVNKHVYTIRFTHEDCNVDLSLSPREQHRIKFRFNTSDFISFHDEVIFQSRILLEYIVHTNNLPSDFTTTHKIDSLILTDTSCGLVSVTSSNYRRVRNLLISVRRIPDPKIYAELEHASNKPERVSKFAAGLDFKANEALILGPGKRATISTGVKCSLPPHSYLRIAPRSGLASKHGIDVLAGVIDSDYRGEIKVCLINFGDEDFEIKKGDRIAQGILTPVYLSEIVVKESLDYTSRGDGGFGSSGK